jgi:hypothetical protein
MALPHGRASDTAPISAWPQPGASEIKAVLNFRSVTRYQRVILW